MAKYFKPSTVLNATNSVLKGVSIDKHGNFKEIRVAFKFKPQDNACVHHESARLNPIEQAWNNQPASL